jgi:hypothetical protein
MMGQLSIGYDDYGRPIICGDEKLIEQAQEIKGQRAGTIGGGVTAASLKSHYRSAWQNPTAENIQWYLAAKQKYIDTHYLEG